MRPSHGVIPPRGTRVWAYIGVNSFGGPAGQIAVMHRELVERRRWVSEAPVPARPELLHAPARARRPSSSPPTSAGSCTAPRRRDRRAACSSSPASSRCWSCPSAYALSRRRSPGSTGCCSASRPRSSPSSSRRSSGSAGAPCAARALQAIAARVVPRDRRSSRCRSRSSSSPPASIGWLVGRRRPSWFPLGGHRRTPRRGRPAGAAARRRGHHPRRDPERDAGARSSRWCSGWCPSPACPSRSGAENVFTQEAMLFSKSAVVTFGGAYAVLGYIAQQAVNRYGWISAARHDHRPRAGRDHARPADHGRAVRRIPRGLQQPRRPAAPGRRRPSARSSPCG